MKKVENIKEAPTKDNNVYNHEQGRFLDSVGVSMEEVLNKADEYNKVASDFDKVSQGVKFLTELYTPKELAMLVIHQTEQANTMAEQLGAKVKRHG